MHESFEKDKKLGKILLDEAAKKAKELASKKEEPKKATLETPVIERNFHHNEEDTENPRHDREGK